MSFTKIPRNTVLLNSWCYSVIGIIPDVDLEIEKKQTVVLREFEFEDY